MPRGALQLLPGRGETVGAALVADARVRGVLFTGSTEVARLLQRTLAGRLNPDGQPVPLIAETGGLNAMVVDTSALPEQVVQDVVGSAFDSAGQRCSALRLLCVQREAAPRIRAMLPSELSLPAAGQGALGIEALSSRPEVAAWMAPLADAATAACVLAERAVSRALAGSCEVPLGAFAEIEAGRLRLRGFVAAPDGSRMASAELRGEQADAEALGLKLAEELRARGAEEILAALGG